MNKGRKGFALMDVMAAVVLLGLFIMPLLMARNNTIHVAEETVLLRQARALAEKKMGELSLAPKADLAAASGDFGDKFPGFRWETEVETKLLSEVLPEAEEEEEEDLDPLASALAEEDEEEEEEEDPLTVVILTLRIYYPSPYVTEGEEPVEAADTVEGEEETARPGVVTAVYVFLEEMEEDDTLSPEPTPAAQPGEETQARQEDRELVDLFGPGPAQPDEEDGEQPPVDGSQPPGDGSGTGEGQ